MQKPLTEAALSWRHQITAAVLLWLSGVGLRLTLLALPPVIPLIHRDLDISESAVGVLSSLPPLLFATAAIPGALLIARFGVLRTLVGGLVLTAVASALRGVAPGVLSLWFTTLFMAMGIAFMQPAMPPLVREWLPGRIGFGTAVYANGLLMGEVFSASLTIPLVLPLVDGSWRWSLVIWSLPVLATAGLVLLLAPRRPDVATPMRPMFGRWWPDWRSPMLWRLGLVLGGVNSLYLSTNAFLPDYLHHTDRSALISPALTALNFWQLPATLVMAFFAARLTRRGWPFLVCGLVSLCSVAAMVLLPGLWVIGMAGLLGFINALALILILALPPLLAAPEDVPRLSAGIFTISYSTAVLIPILGGLAWDLTGVPLAAFVPIGLSALLIIGLAPTLRFERE